MLRKIFVNGSLITHGYKSHPRSEKKKFFLPPMLRKFFSSFGQSYQAARDHTNFRRRCIRSKSLILYKLVINLLVQHAIDSHLLPKSIKFEHAFDRLNAFRIGLDVIQFTDPEKNLGRYFTLTWSTIKPNSIQG